MTVFFIIKLASINYILKNANYKSNFIELENFKPSSSCKKGDYKCRNSYGDEICVNESKKQFACAKYSTLLCDDYSVLKNDMYSDILMDYM